MLINFNPLVYFDELVEKVFEPIAKKYIKLFPKAFKGKKCYVYCETDEIFTTVEKFQMITLLKGFWIWQKEVNYLTLRITGNERKLIFDEISKIRKTVIFDEDDESIEFYFKKDKY